MDVEVEPEPAAEEREALAEALAELLAERPGDRSAWWWEGVAENVAEDYAG